MYNPDKGTLYGTTIYKIGNGEYDRKNDNTNAKVSPTFKYSDISQRVELGLGHSLVAIGLLNYTIDDEYDNETNKYKSSGLQALSFGARYRLSDKIKLPFNVDIGVMFKPSLNDKKDPNKNDDGTTNSGGHDITFSARAGTSKLYLKAYLQYNMEQTTVNATTNDAEYTVDPYMKLGANLGSQFSPMEKLLIDGSAHITRMGEIVTNYDAGGDSTSEANISLGAELQGYYEFYKSISANLGFKYMSFQDKEAKTGTTKYIYSDNSASIINIGASYRY